MRTLLVSRFEKVRTTIQLWVDCASSPAGYIRRGGRTNRSIKVKRLIVSSVVAGCLVGISAQSASADPAVPNGDNCAGVFVSGAAAPGFGAQVSTTAHAQLVDNFGLANCGQTSGQNP